MDLSLFKNITKNLLLTVYLSVALAACKQMLPDINPSVEQPPERVYEDRVAKEECFAEKIEGFDIFSMKMIYVNRNGHCISDDPCNVGIPISIMETWAESCNAQGGDVLTTQQAKLSSCSLCSVDAKFEISAEDYAKYFCLEGKRFVSKINPEFEIEFSGRNYIEYFGNFSNSQPYYCEDGKLNTFSSYGYLDRTSEMELLPNGNLRLGLSEYDLK